MTWKTGFCLIKPFKGRSVQACPFRKFHPVGIRAVRQNHRIIRDDAFEGAKLSHGKTVSGKAKGRPLQEGRHPRCRPRAPAYPPSIRPSPPGTVQGLLRRAHILSAHSTRGTMAPFKPKPRQPHMTKAELRAQGIQALAQVTTPIIKLPMKIRRQCGRCGDFNSVLVEPGQAVPAFKCSACGYAAG
jgi:hypothetical protein